MTVIERYFIVVLFIMLCKVVPLVLLLASVDDHKSERVVFYCELTVVLFAMFLVQHDLTILSTSE